ncbi:MAG TPA: GNAT family N-acetyltransferase [Candidatus Bathyarchaeia archaeon]|nr:GNAT family N-acetyltransferase [Candidatus Bathyarchaeia archaeon]
MSAVSYRKARVEDFPGMLSLIRTSFDGVLREHGFFDASPFASSKMPAIPQQGFPWFEMGLKEDSEGFWVAEVEGKMAGLTLSWVRGSLWYLAHLFVSPEHQGLNIGQNLMEKAMKHHKNSAITNRALVTFAYNPVSISLYARHGIYPREPLYWMEGPSQNVKTNASSTKLRSEKVVDFEKSRRILSKIDELSLGYPREKNHEFLQSLPTVQCHLFSIGNEPIGYAYVWKNGRVGPLASVMHEIFRDVLKSAFKLAAAEGAATVGIAATGSNEQLMQVALEQKMRILDNYLFMSSKPFSNFSNYVLYPTGAML